MVSGTLAGAKTCVPVVPGTSYAFGASAFLPDDGSGLLSQVAYTVARWWSLPGCDGTRLGQTERQTDVTIPGAWGTVEAAAVAPVAAMSAELTLLTARPQGAAAIAFFDNAFFADGTCSMPVARRFTATGSSPPG